MPIVDFEVPKGDLGSESRVLECDFLPRIGELVKLNHCKGLHDAPLFVVEQVIHELDDSDPPALKPLVRLAVLE